MESKTSKKTTINPRAKLTQLTLAAALAVGIPAWSSQAYAQLNEDFTPNKLPNSLNEAREGGLDIFVDRISENNNKFIDLGDKICNYLHDKYIEMRIEAQLRRGLSIDFGDSEVEEYLQRNNFTPEISANVKGFTKGMKSVIAEVTYKLGVDRAKIIRQYEVGVDGEYVYGILETGKTWAKRYGKEITLSELYSTIKLRNRIQNRWNLKQREATSANYNMDYELTPKAFMGFGSFLEEKYRASKDGLVMPNDMGRAQVGICYKLYDKYGNIQNNITSFVVEQYVNPRRDGNWRFDSVISKTEWKDGIVIGTEESRFDKDSFFKRFKRDAKSLFNDIF